MTAPSFSSFAPSFSSFPEFDTGLKDDVREEKGDKKKHKKRKHKQERHKRETSPEREDVANDLLLDRLSYSDKRGDFLNIQFGGLHVGDVPKYNLVGSMVQLLLYGSS